ncbi:MerR family transcriptional regulator [Aurantiacibacter gangjinensis]|uniref:MerR family transcriptional regulator n=1 Tax=Aurantiacibacter gangjinensis TaxID=502682 RepID=A0A0G9MS48_9SPHN|nr:MerR family DNA-binding transcriptional regulator [Aurantiacibacter gangjinensis]APE28424.1 putative transcriptional regulator LiuR of leucine degradation pathway, MerR family [Aurantiacibacter gangjinensis]KLE33581.1 MerR family transcriptional regulator [Aurantiacibacter gangjinensis]
MPDSVATMNEAQGNEPLKSIAEAAEALSVTQRTLRFYEDKGLIAPQRVGTMRAYSKREMGRMQLILRGKRLGFSIREIGEFLSLYDEDDTQKVEQMRHLQMQINQRLTELEEQQSAIQQTIRELKQMDAEAQDKIARLKAQR